MKKIIAGKEYIFMEVDWCKKFNCKWFNTHDEKCMLSGQKTVNELYCLRYHQWLNRVAKNI